jgi:hypothetical protein
MIGCSPNDAITGRWTEQNGSGGESVKVPFNAVLAGLNVYLYLTSKGEFLNAWCETV